MGLIQRLKHYSLPDLRGDGVAGLTLAVLLVPQAMAYALLAGLPPVTGLYAASIPALVYAWLGASRHLSVGPVAIVSLLIASGLEPLAEPLTPEYHRLAVGLAALVGGLWVILGLLRAGFLANFLSQPVIVGFNAAAALLTAASQLRPLLGIQRAAVPEATSENPWPVLWHLDAAHGTTVALGLGAIALLMLIRRFAPRLPGPLLASAGGAVIVWWSGLGQGELAVVGEVPLGLPAPALPQVVGSEILTLLPTALTIVVVGYASSITVIKALAANAREPIRPNRELWALGVANLAGSGFAAFPTSGALARSVLNAQVGARSQLSGLFAALLVMATLLVLAPAFEHLPLSVLAAIIILSVLKLVDVPAAVQVWKTRRSDGITLLITLGATLVLGLIEGLAIGLALALALFVRRTAVPHWAELGRIPGTTVYRNVDRFEVETCPQIGILRVDAPLYFANARFLEQRIDEMFAERPDMQLLALECSSVNDMDATAVQTLERVITTLRANGNDLHLIGAIGPVRDIIARSGLGERLGADNMHRTIVEAAPALMEKISRSYCERSCAMAAFPECSLIPRIRKPSESAEKTRYSPQI